MEIVLSSIKPPSLPTKKQEKSMTTRILQSSQMALAMKPSGSDVRASKCAPKSPWGGNRGAVLWRSGAQVWKVIECTADSKAFFPACIWYNKALINVVHPDVETRKFVLATFIFSCCRNVLW